MGVPSDSPLRHRCNVLALDGGGVRGLSSLMIVEDLMQYINAAIEEKVHGAETLAKVELQDVFDFVAGTSTGGMIAIMLGKLRMNPQQCIKAYKDLSRVIFEKKRIRGRFTHGLAKTRYSGKRLEQCIRDLLLEEGKEKKEVHVGIKMDSESNDSNIACAVVCREHTEQSIYSDLKEGAVPICSLQCHKQVRCSVIEAARATSAAPTYFPVQQIGDRYFVDGGMEYNNPSHAIFEHYAVFNCVAASRGRAGNASKVADGARHAHLDLSRVRFVNIGTGDKPKDRMTRKRDFVAEHLIPGTIRMGVFLKRTLTEIAVESERVAKDMVTLAWVSNSDSNVDLMYERFSADTGVCYIKLDKYKDITKIETMTRDYLDDSMTRERLKDLGRNIAEEFLEKRRRSTANGPASFNVPATNSVQSPNSDLQRLQSPGLSLCAQSSMTGSSSEYTNGATPGAKDPSTKSSVPSTSSVPLKTSNGINPADSKTTTAAT